MLNQKTPSNNEYVSVLTEGVAPVTTADLASYGSIADSDALQLYINAAIAELEARHTIAITPKTYEYKADYHQATRGYVGLTSVPAIRAAYITLPTANVATVTSVTDSGVAADYTSNGHKVFTRATCNIVILYGAGYTAANIPADIKTAVLKLATYTYDHRGKCQEGMNTIDAAGAAIKRFEVYL